MQKIELIRIYQRKAALVIDDMTDMRGSIRRMLGNFGLASIDVAGSGEEAIQKCESNRYDIILADYNLGDGKSGQQLLEELRYRGLLPHTATYVMVTAETTRAMVFGALEYQPDDYLTKPFSQPLLQQRLDRLMMEKETLREVNLALDAQDWQEAIRLSEGHIAQRGRYAGRCLRIKALCHEKLREFGKAQAIYQAAQAERSLDWAQIGLGKCLLAKEELDGAEEIFQQLVDNNCLCLEAYDRLAEIKARKGHVAEAQQLLEHASDISPNAILRQQTLAAISQDNGDWERAEKAHRRVLRLGAGSCYESPENFLRMARCLAAQIRQGGDPKRLKEVEETLERARRRYPNNEEVAVQTRLVAAMTRADAGQPTRARQDVEAVMAAVGADSSPAVTLELARAWQSIGDTNQAKSLLLDLTARFPDDEALWEEIDRVSDEPLSNKGKARAAALNAQGRELFAANRFQQAIRLFSEALRLSPNNVALKLNLLLALVKEMTANGAAPAELALADSTVQSIKNLSSEHPLHERLTVLRAHLDRLQAAA